VSTWRATYHDHFFVGNKDSLTRNLRVSGRLLPLAPLTIQATAYDYALSISGTRTRNEMATTRGRGDFRDCPPTDGSLGGWRDE
jgi:hypothetical protein